MEYIRNFEQYNDDLLLESLNLGSLLDKFRANPNKKIAMLIIGSMLSSFTPQKAVEIVNHRMGMKPHQKEILVDTINSFKSATAFKLSEEGLKFIKIIETDKNGKPKLKAYKIGDGKITVGYGHAEPIKTSKYKVGDVITETQAKSLLIHDLNVAAKGVKRMFRQWEAQNIHVKITQNQYDVLVSMAFNMGVSSLRQTQFIQTLKHHGAEKAAGLIKSTGLSNDYPGLETRRQKEYEMFIS